MNNSPRSADVVIADTQVLIIEGLKALLKHDFTITGVAGSMEELYRIIKDKAPALLIIDFALADFESMDQLKKLKADFPQTTIIVLTNSLTRSDVVELTGCGIKNILNKSVEKEEFFSCIDAAMKGRKYYSQQILDLLTEPMDKRTVSSGNVQLTASEIEIVRLFSQGLTSKDVAAKKFLSVHTVMTHRKNIMRKLGASNASEMIMFAIRSGLIDNIEYHI